MCEKLAQPTNTADSTFALVLFSRAYRMPRDLWKSCRQISLLYNNLYKVSLCGKLFPPSAVPNCSLSFQHMCQIGRADHSHPIPRLRVLRYSFTRADARSRHNESP